MCSGKTMLCAILIASAILMASCDVGKPTSCCPRVSARKIKETVVKFVIQKEDLPCVEAVMFFTENEDRYYCSKPNLPWVASKMKEIIAKNDEKKLNKTTNPTENDNFFVLRVRHM